MRVYAKCKTGLEDVWITRMNQSLRLQDSAPAASTTRKTLDKDPG